MDIKQTIRRLVVRYKTNDPFQVAERKNILVLTESLGNILGYYNASRRTQMIHVNSRLDSRLRKFVCAHELGHAVLHPKVNTPFLRRSTFYSIDKIEREANEFAVELLVPDEDIRRYGSITVREVAARYGIPHELMRLKRPM